MTVTGTVGSQYVFDESTGFGFDFNGNGTRFMRVQFGGVSIPQGSFVITGATYAANVARYILTDGVSGMGNPAANQWSLVAGGADVLIGSTTNIVITSGVALQLGNSAVTGLIAGALAALTTASITIKDSTGTVYRVPCITP